MMDIFIIRGVKDGKYLTPQMELVESKGQINDRIRLEKMKKYLKTTKK